MSFKHIKKKDGSCTDAIRCYYVLIWLLYSYAWKSDEIQITCLSTEDHVIGEFLKISFAS